MYDGAIEAVLLCAQTVGPKFEVASIRLCSPADSGGRSGGDPSTPSPDRLALNCSTVGSLIQRAYAQAGKQIPLPGGPPWIYTERYRIDAKADGPQTREMLNGPMLQALLRERFHLEIRREDREVQVYEMREADGGSKLRPSTSESREPDLSRIRAAREAGKTPPPTCGIFFGRKKDAPGTVSINTRGITIAVFADDLSQLLDRPVVDKTGIAGNFDLCGEFVPDASTPGLLGRAFFAAPDGVAPEPGPSIIPALRQQLGLRLTPARGPREFLVIDHIQRPSEN